LIASGNATNGDSSFHGAGVAVVWKVTGRRKAKDEASVLGDL